MGKVTKTAVVRDGEIVIRDIMTVVYTFDHRYGDAGLLGVFNKVMVGVLEDPDTFNANNYKELMSYEEMARNRQLK